MFPGEVGGRSSVSTESSCNHATDGDGDAPARPLTRLGEGVGAWAVREGRHQSSAPGLVECYLRLLLGLIK